MLGSLITSRGRRRVLALLFMHPASEFYVREIARMTGEQVNAVRRELEILEKGGIVVSERRGNLKYFALDKQCPIYCELKSIIVKTEGIGSVLREHLKGVDGVEFVFVYGSTALGEERQKSDIDLMVIGKVPIEKLNKAVGEAQRKLLREVNYIVYPPKEFLEKRSKGFIQEVVRNKKIMVVGDEDEFKRFAERGKNKESRS